MKKTFLFILFLSASTSSWSQGVSVSPAGTPADPSAALDLNYVDKGLLVPRVSLVQTTSPSPVLAPATSLLVYNTTTINDVTPGYYFWDGLKWARLMVDNGSGGGGGGSTNVNCNTTFNDGWTIRGDGSGGCNRRP